MTMRAKLERNTTTATDDFNNPAAPSWSTLATVACWAWTRSRNEIIDGDKTIVVEDMRAMLPSGTDVTERDRVAQIEDRQGTVLFQGPYGIEAVTRREGHLAIMLHRDR